MKEDSKNMVKLGLFILSGTLLLILGLYYIGSQKNIFHRTITVSTGFNNVNGLMPGNNVRFNGINVGTVSKLSSISDTVVKVEFTVDQEISKLINEAAIVSIGTDGLLGNKLLNISPSKTKAEPITEGAELASVNPLQMDNTLRSLSNTSGNLEIITDNLKTLSGDVTSKGSLWALLRDSSISKNVKSALVNIRLMSNNALAVTGDLQSITSGIKNGKGSIGALVADTSLSARIKQIVVKFEKLNDTAAVITGDVSYLLNQLKQGKGSIGVLLKDTMVVHNLNKSILTIDTAAGNLNDNMKALKHTWPFKKYFKN
ncbi:MAG: MCE family protein [Bacteroidia bacterium]|nr:MCE family protein [Bacteroidia bacterium]